MNFNPQQKAWILLICLVLSSGGAVFTTSYLGGSKLWFAVVGGFIAAATNVYHALSSSPKEQINDTNKTP